MRLKNQEFSVAFNGIISLLDKEEITVEYVQKGTWRGVRRKCKVGWIEKHEMQELVNADLEPQCPL